MCISVFDESDPKQHTMKVLFGCGLYFGFRGRMEHHDLLKRNIGTGIFEEGHQFSGMKYVAVRMMNDKTNKITLHNPRERDCGKLMRLPVLNNDPTSNCFAGSLLRYIEKTDKDQIHLHCRAVPEKNRKVQMNKGLKGFYYQNLNIGPNTISELFKEGAEICGLLSEDFCPHSLRALFITTLVNDENVSIQESMKAARHSSVSAHLEYIQTGKKSEGKRIECLVGAAAKMEKNSVGPNLVENKVSGSLKKSPGPSPKNHSTPQKTPPGFSTQMEWIRFCEEKKEFIKALGLSPESSQESIDISKAKRKIDDLGEVAVKKRKAHKGKLLKEIRKLRSELREKKALLDEKSEQFDSANSMFDRVIERERLYRRELDMHYERDMEEKSRNINCLLHSQDKNQKRVIELQEMYTK